MSEQPTFFIYPELNSLRKTILEMQDLYADTKPNLNQRIGLLKPWISTAPLLAIGARLYPEGSKVSDPTLQSLHDQVSGLISDMNAFIQSAGNRSALLHGDALDRLLKVFDSHFQPFEKSIQRIFSKRLKATLEDKKFSITLFRCARALDLLTLVMNTFFEVLDYLPGFPELPKLLKSHLGNYGKLIYKHSKINDFTIFADMLAIWVKRWKNRPEIVDGINWWLDLGTLQMSRSKNIDHYADGDVLVNVMPNRGLVTELASISGRLPAGVGISGHGQVIVLDASKLMPGCYDGLSVKGKTNEGFVFQAELPPLQFGYDQEAVYEVASPIFLHACIEGAVLAIPLDPDGEIVEAQVTGGGMPPGTRFSTVTGLISVMNPSKLRAGTYPMTVTTWDRTGGHTEHLIELELLHPGANIPSNVSVKQPINPKKVISAASAANMLARKNWQGNPDRGELMERELRTDQGEAGINMPLVAGTQTHFPVSVAPIRNAEGVLMEVPEFLLGGIQSNAGIGSILAMINTGSGIPMALELISGEIPAGLTLTPQGYFILTQPPLKQGHYQFKLNVVISESDEFVLKVAMEILEGNPNTPMDV